MWLALPLLVLAAAKPGPELVVLPLASSDALASQSLEAWKLVTAEVNKSRRKLKASTGLQKKQHDFLIGPVREQARDCGDKLACLAEIGTALGADFLLVGKLDAQGIGLRVIDVAQKAQVAEGGSPPTLATQAVKKQAVAAVRSLVAAFAAYQKKGAAPKKPPEVAETPPPETPPPESTETRGGAPVLALGKLNIAKDQLGDVTQVSIDGESVLFAGDGTIAWSGAPGTHRVRAVRADGNALSKEVVVEPGQTQFLSLEFPILAPPTVVAKNEDEGGVTSKWWFWTSLGVAVVAGSATAVLLVSGEKGGPELPDSTGTIRGTY